MALRGQKGLARVPNQPLCHTPPHSASAVCFPFRDTPGNLCSSPAASACSNSHLSQLVNLPQKWSRGLSSCGQSRGTQRAPARLGAALSLVHHTLTRGMSSLPTPGRAPAAAAEPALASASSISQPRLQIQRQTGAWGLTQSPVPSRSSRQAQLGHW